MSCIPSERHPDLVPDFARRLAGVLGLSFEPVLIGEDGLPGIRLPASEAEVVWRIVG